MGGEGGNETVSGATGTVIPPPAGGEPPPGGPPPPPGGTDPPPGDGDPPLPSDSAPDPGVADIRVEFLAALNQARSVARMCGNTAFPPAPPVTWSGELAMAAYLHSEDMALNGFFSHTGSDGSSPGQRITRQGYTWRAYGENIAVGYPSVSSVIQGWLESEGHCRNIMNPAFTEIGAGYAIGGFGTNPAARYWTFDLADR